MKTLSDNASLLWVLRRFDQGIPITLASFSTEYMRCPALKNASIDGGSITNIVEKACVDGFLQRKWRTYENVYTITETGMEKKSKLEWSKEIVAELTEGK